MGQGNELGSEVQLQASSYLSSLNVLHRHALSVKNSVRSVGGLRRASGFISNLLELNSQGVSQQGVLSSLPALEDAGLEFTSGIGDDEQTHNLPENTKL